jgi:hypothetical protein
VTPSKKAVVGWVLVSYFMIAGGFTLAAVAVTLADISSQWARDAAFFVGALIGGLFAGRASPHKAVIEPAVAGLLFVPTLVGVIAVGLGWRFAWGAEGDGVLAIALKMALVSGLGGLVGGLIGRRTSTGAGRDDAFRWWGISILINFGATFIVVMLVTVVVARSTGQDVDGEVALIFLGLALAELTSGFVAQAAAPRRMPWTCGAGSFAIVLLAVTFASRDGNFSVSTLMGACILWGLATLVGALGALIGWHAIGRHRDLPAATDLPEVRLHS